MCERKERKRVCGCMSFCVVVLAVSVQCISTCLIGKESVCVCVCLNTVSHLSSIFGMERSEVRVRESSWRRKKLSQKK